jgi:hypothetical protein
MEKTLWKTIRDKLPNFFIQRIETQIERGIPDVHYCVAGISGWIEGKYIKSPKRDNTKIKLKLTVEQIVYILVKKDREIYLFDAKDGNDLAIGVTREEWEQKALAKNWENIKLILSKK